MSGPAPAPGRRGFFWRNPRPAPVRGLPALIPWMGPRFSPPISNGGPSVGWAGRVPGRGQGRGMSKNMPRPGLSSGAGWEKGPGARVFRGPGVPVTNSTCGSVTAPLPIPGWRPTAVLLILCRALGYPSCYVSGAVPLKPSPTLHVLFCVFFGARLLSFVLLPSGLCSLRQWFLVCFLLVFGWFFPSLYLRAWSCGECSCRLSGGLFPSLGKMCGWSHTRGTWSGGRPWGGEDTGVFLCHSFSCIRVLVP